MPCLSSSSSPQKPEVPMLKIHSAVLSTKPSIPSYTTLHRLHWIWQRSRSVCRWPLYTSICQSKLSCEIVTAWLLQAVQLIMPSTSQGPRNEAKVQPSNSHNLCTYFYVIDAYWPLRHPRKNLTWTLCIHFFISTEMFLTTSAERSVLSWWWTLILLPVE